MSRCFFCDVLGYCPGMYRIVRWHMRRVAARMSG